MHLVGHIQLTPVVRIRVSHNSRLSRSWHRGPISGRVSYDSVSDENINFCNYRYDTTSHAFVIGHLSLEIYCCELVAQAFSACNSTDSRLLTGQTVFLV
jgi:hypothetical protein